MCVCMSLSAIVGEYRELLGTLCLHYRVSISKIPRLLLGTSTVCFLCNCFCGFSILYLQLLYQFLVSVVQKRWSCPHQLVSEHLQARNIGLLMIRSNRNIFSNAGDRLRNRNLRRLTRKQLRSPHYAQILALKRI